MIIAIDHQLRKILYLACAGLGVLVIAMLVICFSQWHQDWVLIHQRPSIAVVQTDPTTAMINGLPKAHLFGEAFSKGDMAITNLQLRVTGIVKVNQEDGSNFSKAYISVSGQPAKIFEVDDSLSDGVKIYSITPDSVILENDGHLEKLPLPREKLQFKPLNTEEAF